MNHVEVQWLYDELDLKSALTQLLNCSGQLLKKYFSKKELSSPVKAKSIFKLPLNLVNHLLINPIYVGPKIDILYEDEKILAIHKPFNIHSHPLIYEDQNTVLNFLAMENKLETLRVNEKNYDRGLLYRLDFPTSGLLILSKDESELMNWRKFFQEKMKKKYYLAIVEGDFNKEGHWVHYFKPFGEKGAKQVVSEKESPTASRGEFKLKKIDVYNNHTLLLIDLKTGLRHQIRAQLAALGFPILGDTLYGGSPSSRLFLHCFRYEFSFALEDQNAELFERFFDLNRAFKMCHDMIGSF